MQPVVSKREILVIQRRQAGTGHEYIAEVSINRTWTMDEIIHEAEDDADIIGVLDCTGDFQQPTRPLYREITEQVAVAYLDERRGSGMPLKRMPLFVRNSLAAASYDDQPSYARPRYNGTYQVGGGVVA